MVASAAEALRAQAGRRTASFMADAWRGAEVLGIGHHPAPRASLGTAAKVAVDEAFRSLMIALTDLPSASEMRLVKHELAEAGAYFDDRGWLDDAASYHLRPPELTSPTVRPRHSWGTEFEHLQFVSGYEPDADEPGRDRWMSYRKPRTAHAWVMRHRDKPRPWLVCVHGFRMGFPLADFHAFRANWLHHELGLNLVFPVLPMHGERKIGKRSGDGFFSYQFMDTVHAEAQAIWDLRRVIDWIRAQGVEDIGVYGVSLGGYTAALLAGFERDLTCVIAGMPTVCFSTLLQDHAPKRLLGMAERTKLGWDMVSRVLQVISPLAVQPQVPHENRYLYAGAADRVVPREHVLDLWRHWGKPQLQWFEGSHLSFTWESVINDVVYRSLRSSGLLPGRRRPEAVRSQAA